MLYVNDIFLSIQGESSYAGYPCNFIRLAGCNLKCSYCDTLEALDTKNSKKLRLNEIMEAVRKTGGGIRLAEVTGGEPLVQEGVYGLFEELIGSGYRVLLETNGTLNLKKVPAEVVKIVDVKCPSSGFPDKFDYGNLSSIRETDEVKFVIGTGEDYDFAKKYMETRKLRTEKIIFSSAESVLAPESLAQKILKDRLNVRLGIQLHKVLKLK